jgi:outer membrane receptor protein involved in Fe transport
MNIEVRARIVSGLAVIVFLVAHSLAQVGPEFKYSGVVTDTQDLDVAGAAVTVTSEGHAVHTVSDKGGRFTANLEYGPSAIVQVQVAGFAPQQANIEANDPITLKLSPAAVSQNLVVSAAGTAVAQIDSPASVKIVTATQLNEASSAFLDDKLRQVTGLELFRRSSSRVANPTSQGLSLRGLGSTAASRTLVLADSIPQNDPFGGWIHWDEIPQTTIQEVEVLRGGASDLYGSSAIGGVVDLLQQSPGPASYDAEFDYGSENTPHGVVSGTLAHGPWSGLVAGEFLRTDGYITVAPSQRGPVDIPANVDYENAHVDIRRLLGERGSAFVRGNVLDESRDNGTPLTTNATRLWRYSTGADWTPTKTGAFSMRLFGSTENYRQGFSSINAARTFERLTRLQHVPTQELGAAAKWVQSLGTKVTVVGGADTHDIRATDLENPIGAAGAISGVVDTTSRQRISGFYGQALVQLSRWTFTGALRGDYFTNLDTRTINQTLPKPATITAIPNRSETVASPKLGVVRRITSNVAITATGFRAFRAPTMNELYRTGQVGQQITLANPNLLSERATGWEVGVQIAQPSRNSVLRGSYFWTEVNRPITALTISTSATQIINQRANLGQIQSRGVNLDYQSQLLSWMTVNAGYQFAQATVTRFDQKPSLVGNWIPQVPQQMGTAQVRFFKQKWGLLSVQGRASGRQYDDDQNLFVLHSFFRFDVYGSHELGARAEVFAAAENLFDRSIEVGRTPILTLGTPRVMRVGIRIHSRR